MNDLVERLRENSAEIVADTLPRWKNIDEDMDKAADEIKQAKRDVLLEAIDLYSPDDTVTDYQEESGYV